MWSGQLNYHNLLSKSMKLKVSLGAHQLVQVSLNYTFPERLGLLIDGTHSVSLPKHWNHDSNSAGGVTGLQEISKRNIDHNPQSLHNVATNLGILSMASRLWVEDLPNRLHCQTFTIHSDHLFGVLWSVRQLRNWIATGLWKAHGSGQSFFFQLHPWVNIYDLMIEFKKWSHWHKAGMRKLFQ